MADLYTLVRTMRAALRDACHNGLIYWEPNTERGHREKALMIARIENTVAAVDAALAEPPAPASDVAGLVEGLIAFASPIEEGYELPAAGQVMRRAAAALTAQAGEIERLKQRNADLCDALALTDDRMKAVSEAADNIADMISEGVDDLPDDTPVVVHIGKRASSENPASGEGWKARMRERLNDPEVKQALRDNHARMKAPTPPKEGV